MTAGLLPFRVELKANGEHTVEVDGQDVSDRVAAIGLQSAPGSSPVLLLRQPVGAVEIAAEGIVRVEGESAVDATQEIVTFLENVSADELEKEVLNNMGWGGSTMETAIEVLIKWARGEA